MTAREETVIQLLCNVSIPTINLEPNQTVDQRCLHIGKETILVELDLRTINKDTFYEAVRELLGENGLVFGREPMCPVGVQKFDCFTEKKTKVEGATKSECSMRPE